MLFGFLLSFLLNSEIKSRTKKGGDSGVLFTSWRYPQKATGAWRKDELGCVSGRPPSQTTFSKTCSNAHRHPSLQSSPPFHSASFNFLSKEAQSQTLPPCVHVPQKPNSRHLCIREDASVRKRSRKQSRVHVVTPDPRLRDSPERPTDESGSSNSEI